MTDRQRRKLNMQKRVRRHLLDHPIVPANALVTAESTALNLSIAQADALDSGRKLGRGVFLGGAAERRALRSELMSELRDLANIARTLDKAVYPDVAVQLRVAGLTSFAAVLTHARKVADVIEPIEQVFADHGASATVADDLEAMITGLEQASARRTSGLDNQVGKRRGLENALENGMARVRKLDAILSKVFKKDPERLAAWKAARRVERDPVYKDEESTTPTPAPTPAPATGSSNN